MPKRPLDDAVLDHGLRNVMQSLPELIAGVDPRLQSTSTLPDAPVVKRKKKAKGALSAPRTNRACIHCRKLKMRCDDNLEPPCRRCKNGGLACVFERRADFVLNPQDSAWQSHIEHKLDLLSATVDAILGALHERGIARGIPATHDGGAYATLLNSGESQNGSPAYMGHGDEEGEDAGGEHFHSHGGQGQLGDVEVFSHEADIAIASATALAVAEVGSSNYSGAYELPDPDYRSRIEGRGEDDVDTEHDESTALEMAVFGSLPTQ